MLGEVTAHGRRNLYCAARLLGSTVLSFADTQHQRHTPDVAAATAVAVFHAFTQQTGCNGGGTSDRPGRAHLTRHTDPRLRQ